MKKIEFKLIRIGEFEVEIHSRKIVIRVHRMVHDEEIDKIVKILQDGGWCDNPQIIGILFDYAPNCSIIITEEYIKNFYKAFGITEEELEILESEKWKTTDDDIPY